MADDVELWRAALQQCLYNHSHQLPIFLGHLAISLVYRFQQRGVLSDLDEVISLHRAALAHHAAGHPRRSTSLNDLAIALQLRFQQRGVMDDLDEAIKLHRATLALRQPGHSDRPMSLNNLANSLHNRCVKLDVLSDLHKAIELLQAALEICLPGHHLRPQLLNSLADSHLHRFQRGRVLFDLDEAIRLNRAALALCPLGHPDRFGSLNNLANTLVVRSSERRALSDLDEVVNLHRTALALCPIGHPHRLMSLNNLGVSLGNRFDHRGVPSDLDEIIELHRDALVLCPPGHPLRYGFLHNLANRLVDKFQQCNVLSDLDEAIDHHRTALAVCPLGHPDRCSSLDNLANSLRVRFQQRKILSDIDEGIELRRGALVLCPPGHFYRSTSLKNLALSLQYRFKQQGQPSDLDEAFSFYLQLSQQSHPVSRIDICAAKSWITSAEQAKHGSALVAYQTTLKFLDQYVAVIAPSSSHFDVVKSVTSSIAMDAFSCCVRHGALTNAVELVEQGRAVLWTQLARLRTPLDELSASSVAGDALAEEFKKLSSSLRDVFDASTKDQSPQIWQLTMQWDGVVSRIRQLPDFSRFLLPPLFSDLQRAAECGPVIVVNGSKYSCDALIITRDQDPILISLDISLAEVSELSSEFQSLTKRVGSSDHQLESHKVVGILRKLWTHIVSPVVQALRELIKPGSRIWWCPTAEFTLLPLHAAGPYEKRSHNLSHFYVSSYTSTLTALIRARRHVSRYASIQHFVAVGQGHPDGGKELRHVATELNIVEKRVAPVLSFTSLADSDATVQGASDAFSRAQWLHLACHGMPNQKQPFESSFAMRDGPFTIMDIIRSRLQNPEFAFLSACHTTVGDESSPDEAIHLAAAMQFSGFRSVIGSMWSVDDEVARHVVTAFYDNLVDGSGRLDCRRAAVSLHNAVKTLRKKIPLEQQIVFVHIGI